MLHFALECFCFFRHILATQPYDLAAGLRNSHLYGMNPSHSLFPVNPSARYSAHQEAFDGEIERSDGNEMQFHFLICIIARQPTYLRVLNACFFVFVSSATSHGCKYNMQLNRCPTPCTTRIRMEQIWIFTYNLLIILCDLCRKTEI